MICIFDCETIPDSDALRAVFGYKGDDKDVALLAQNEQKERTGSSFLPVNFHKVVCISAVIADDFGKFEKVSTISGTNEREMIGNFLNFINRKNPRLISFNGRGFDLPMLMVRAMIYNISCPAYFDDDNREFNKDKWKNYRARYCDTFHMDLLDFISDFRAVSGLNLNSLCKTLKMPGKYDVAGDEVLELFYANQGSKISEYCESDTLNTYLLFLKYELLRGKILLSDYATNLVSMKENLEKTRAKMGYTDIFVNFIDDEILRIENS